MSFVRHHRAFARFSTAATARPRSSLRKPVFILSGISLAFVAYYSLVPCRTDESLSPSRFVPATLIDSVDTSPNTKLLTLAVPPQLYPRDADAFAPISSIFIKDSDIQVERPYTPLESIDENGHIKLWVKKYEHGEVGRWLHSKKVGDSIEIRGPVKTWSALWRTGQWDDVVLISGGTGITPFYQLLHSVFETHDTSFNARFTLLHGSRLLADLPPPSMIQPLVAFSQKYPDRFQLRLLVESTNDTSENRLLHVERGRIGKSVVQDVLGLTHKATWWRRLLGLPAPISLASEKKVLVLICGPEGLVTAVAGPYGRNYSQGQVGGILGDLGLQSHQVWKL